MGSYLTETAKLWKYVLHQFLCACSDMDAEYHWWSGLDYGTWGKCVAYNHVTGQVLCSDTAFSLECVATGVETGRQAT